jgi:peptidoglycan/xylan/chitin deacetylase (PgdA/CDA1 family)
MNGNMVKALFLIGIIAIGAFCLNGCGDSKAETVPDKTVKSEPAETADPGQTDPGKITDSAIEDNDDQGIPVLMYHSVSNKKGSKLFMPVEKFRQQMKYLKDNGYNTLTAEEALEHFKNGSTVPEKSVLITLDDGYSDNYTEAFPILKEYGLKATVFVITASIDKDTGKLTSQQIKEMAENGISIQSHTVNHDDLSSLPYEKQLSTLEDSKKQIENLTGKKVFCLAYPFGKYNKKTIQALQEAGYQMAFTIRPGFAYKSQGILTLSRIRVDGPDKLYIFQHNLYNKNKTSYEK